MMRKVLLVIGLAAALVACSDEGGAGDGDDTLPKRGELATDPTIVSATAQCSCGGEVCPGGPATSHVRVRVDASDPLGTANLGTCAGTLGTASDQGGFVGSSCAMYIPVTTPCAVGQVHTVGLTVSNETGGVSTASVKLTVAN